MLLKEQVTRLLRTIRALLLMFLARLLEFCLLGGVEFTETIKLIMRFFFAKLRIFQIDSAQRAFVALPLLPFLTIAVKCQKVA